MRPNRTLCFQRSTFQRTASQSGVTFPGTVQTIPTCCGIPHKWSEGGHLSLTPVEQFSIIANDFNYGRQTPFPKLSKPTTSPTRKIAGNKEKQYLDRQTVVNFVGNRTFRPRDSKNKELTPFSTTANSTWRLIHQALWYVHSVRETTIHQNLPDDALQFCVLSHYKTSLKLEWTRLLRKQDVRKFGHWCSLIGPRICSVSWRYL